MLRAERRRGAFAQVLRPRSALTPRTWSPLDSVPVTHNSALSEASTAQSDASIPNWNAAVCAVWIAHTSQIKWL